VGVTERFTDASGVRIRYLDNSPIEPVGLPVLFSPGFTDFADEYIDLLEYFAPRRVLVVEVRGRGQSESPATGYLAADHAHDLQAVLVDARIERFHLMTFSRGTTWGLDTVLADPSRVESVSIGDYPCREIAVDPSMAETVMTTRFRGIPMTERVGAHVPRQMFGSATARQLTAELAATGLPVLLATGDQTGCMVTSEVIDDYRAHISEIEIVTIAGASHDLFRPDRLAYPRAVGDFIERRER
jgi:pimeloyl-ACP methyl ester carboxylesterase